MSDGNPSIHSNPLSRATDILQQAIMDLPPGFTRNDAYVAVTNAAPEAFGFGWRLLNYSHVRGRLVKADRLAREANGGQYVSGNAVESYRNSLADAYARIAELEATIEGNDAVKKPAADQTGGFHPNTQWPSE